MGKKKFIDGLESLFGTTDVLEEEGFLKNAQAREEQPNRSAEKAAPKKKSGRKKRTYSGKTFTSDLNSLFEQALTETIEEKMHKERMEVEADKKAKAKRFRRRAMDGLDALIRQTSTSKQNEVKEVVIPTKKRVTFVFDKKKLARLKQIAKLEKAYLKDIIGDLISEFLDEYEDKQTDNTQ